MNPLARAYSQTASSGSPSNPHSRTWALPGKSVASERESLGDKFSSKSNFMGDDVQTAVTVCGECKARLNVVGSDVRKIVQDLRNSHSATEIIEDVGNRDASTTDAGLSATDAWVDGDTLPIIHGEKVGFGAF